MQRLILFAAIMLSACGSEQPNNSYKMHYDMGVVQTVEVGQPETKVTTNTSTLYLKTTQAIDIPVMLNKEIGFDYETQNGWIVSQTVHGEGFSIACEEVCVK